MASNYNITDASVANNFKIKYDDKSLNTYNGKVATLARANKSFNFVGKQREMDVPTGFQGGAGSGSLPRANRGIYVKPVVTRKKQYCVCEVDRETIYAAKDEGAFVDSMAETVKKTVEKFNWNIQRQLQNSLVNGSLGTVETATLVSGVTWDLVITSATWKVANWEIRDFVNIESGNSDLFEITSVTPSSRTVRVVRQGGGQVPAVSDVVFLQGSENNDIQSLVGVLAATSSTLYGVDVGYRWQAAQVPANGAGISSALMDQTALTIDANTGLTPNLGICGHTQFRKMLALQEDNKRYPLGPKAENLVGKISFSAVEYYTVQGPIPVIVDRFCDDSIFEFVNDNYFDLLHAPGMGWMDDEGFVFVRKEDDDAYSARYGSYMNSYIPPSPHGYLYGLAT